MILKKPKKTSNCFTLSKSEKKNSLKKWFSINCIKSQITKKNEASFICPRKKKPGNILEDIRKYIYARDGCNLNEIYHSKHV